METVLLINGYDLMADDHEGLIRMLAVAAGKVNQAELADWIRNYLLESDE